MVEASPANDWQMQKQQSVLDMQTRSLNVDITKYDARASGYILDINIISITTDVHNLISFTQLISFLKEPGMKSAQAKKKLLVIDLTS